MIKIDRYKLLKEISTLTKKLDNKQDKDDVIQSLNKKYVGEKIKDKDSIDNKPTYYDYYKKLDNLHKHLKKLVDEEYIYATKGQTEIVNYNGLTYEGELKLEEIKNENIKIKDSNLIKSNINYVSISRIEELESIKSKYDLIRLVQYCKELNITFTYKCYNAISMLLRAIIDHIPPIFNYKDFNEVCNNYNWAKSNKKNILNLQDSLRNISDANLHLQIREKEVLITESQIDFKADLDILLGEIVRIMKKKE